MDRHELQQLDSQVGELIRHGSPSCIRQANSIMVEEFDRILRFALELTRPKLKPKHTIADNYPAGGLTASEPCMYCVDFGKIQTENEQLREALKAIFGYAKNRHTDIHLESYNKAIKEAEQALKEK